jgi:glycosyltransferase involved in cell wall biosynthesis
LQPVSQELRRERGERSGGGRLAFCLVTDSREPSGVGEHMLGLGEALLNDGSVSFVCPPSPMGQLCLERATRLGIDTLALDWGRPRASERFGCWLRTRHVDICHVHAGIGWEGLQVVETARRTGVAVVIRTEHLPYLLTDESERIRHANALRHVDKIICVSNEVRGSFLAAGTPANLVTVIRNGIPARTARNGWNWTHASLALGAHTRIVLTVARYTEQKDHRTLLDAVPAVIACEPRARFIWAGTGPLEESVRRSIHERGLAQHVVLLGQRDDVPDLMAAADIFVLPSRFEGLPLAVLEAMAAGLPVVATRVCGMTEAVQDGVTGLLVQPRDPAVLAATIGELLAKPQLAAQMGKRGRARAQQAFSLNRMAREILALYHEMLTRCRPPHRFETCYPEPVEAAAANS